MNKALGIIWIFVLCSFSGNCQNYANIKRTGIDSTSNVWISATSSTQFYTNYGSIRFETIDSVIFFYEPSQTLLNNLKANDIGWVIKSMTLGKLEKITGEDLKSDLDWVVLINGDSLHGYVEERTQRIVFRNPVKSKDQRILHTDISSYKKGDVIYENFNGMKVLEIRGALSLYSLTVQNTSFNSAGVGTTSGISYYYYVKRKDEVGLTLLSTKGVLRLDATFRKTAETYFNDCPELLKRIRNGNLTKDHPERIVHYYNENCE